MTTKKNNIPESGGWLFRMFEYFTEAIGWLQIAASPLLIGIVIGAVVYFTDQTSVRLVIGISIAMVGLIVGILWANKQWKGKGTVRFMSGIMATPELDNPEQDQHTEPKV